MNDEDLARIEQRVASATPGPWKHDLDCFDGEIQACVSDGKMSMLATLGTDVLAHTVADDIPWTDSDNALRDHAWKRARASQAVKDAAFMANARQDVIDLLAEVRRLQEVERMMKNAAAEAAKAWQALRVSM